ncbi:Imm1 family immunity protein [Sorangium sp. So ce118]
MDTIEFSSGFRTRQPTRDGKTMILTWGINQQALVDSIQEFDALLDQLAEQARGHGVVVQVAHSSGNTLAIGLGREESVLTYFDQQGTSFTSVGEREREDYLTFEFSGDISEMMGAKAVPASKAREAARMFFLDGAPPAIIEWEQECA